MIKCKKKHWFIFCPKKIPLGGCEPVRCMRGRGESSGSVKYEKSRWFGAKQKGTTDWRWEDLFTTLLARISKNLMV
jgi:hypothetical protein